MQPNDYADLHALEDELWWFAGMREITAALLDPISPPNANKVVLDAGCGAGGNLNWLRRYAAPDRILGVDFNSNALSFCRAREHELLAQASVVSLPFRDGVFDLVTSFDVLGQLPDQDDEKALREMHRVLKPRGVVMVRAAAYQRLHSGHDIALHTQQRYDLELLSRKVEAAGFRVLRATYANGLLLPAAILRRLVLKRIGLVDQGSDVKRLPFAVLNKLFKTMLRGEAWWLRRPGARLRFGLSVICVGEKP
jgi:SAM-dependent methyltransferase